MQGFMDMTEGASSVWPLAQLALHQLGYKNDFEKYKETSQLHASTAASFIPGFRVLNDISQILDPFKRKTEDWTQEFTKLIPTTNSEEQDRLHGKIYVDKVPIGENSTKNVQRKNYQEDTIKSLFTGIYTTRINPDTVKAFEKRFVENEVKSAEKEDWNMEKEALIKKYTKLYSESTEPMKATKLERQLKEEMGGANMTETDKSRYSSLVRSIRMANESGWDTFVARIADMNTNDEKTLAFKEKKSTMDPKEFENYVVSLYQKKIISKELRKTIFNLK